jgi:hypothetical protein
MSKKLILLLIVFAVVAGFSGLASALPLIGAVDRSGGASGDRAPIGAFTGETDPLPTQPGGWTVGNYIFSDREYTWSSVAPEIEGTEYVRTFNEDAPSNVTYTVEFPIGARVLITVDDRFGDQQGYVDNIVRDFAAAGTFTDTGWDVVTSEGTPRTLSVYSAVMEAGTYLFHDHASGSNNFYVIWALPLPTQPNNDSPPDGAQDVVLDANLYWSPGLYAASHDVYFGTDPCALPKVDTKSLGDEVYDPPGGLIASTTYYWRIVEVNGPNSWAGPIWSFSTILGKATLLSPLNGAIGPGSTYQGSLYELLKFAPGPTATAHTGYCSDSFDDVNNRVQDANLGALPYPALYQYVVGFPLAPYPANRPLVRGRPYYWTVDESDAYKTCLLFEAGLTTGLWMRATPIRHTQVISGGL